MDLWKYLASSNKPIVIYGTGNGADKLINRLYELQIPVSGIIANDEFVKGQSFRGYKVLHYYEAEKLYNPMILLLAFGTSRKDVIDRILNIAVRQELYAPDLPLYGKQYFTEEYYQNNKERFERIRNRLSDEKSRVLFDTVIKCKLYGDIIQLVACDSDDAWNLLPFSDKETFLDLGAYDGDTVMKFTGLCPDYDSIIAVEPDENNYAKLIRNTAGVERVEYHQCAIGDHWCECEFQSGKGRGSASGKGRKIIYDTVDNLLLNRQISFIKMDIEGSEMEGICGARRSINKWKPNLIVSAYHRPEDMIAVPEKILEMNPDYEIYLRKDYSIPVWDLYFVFLKRRH